MADKAEVARHEEADIGNLVLHHGEPGQSETPSETLILIALIAGRFEHVLMDHTRTTNLEPACPLADRTAATITKKAIYVKFKRRLSEWEKTRAQADGRLTLKEGREEVLRH